jgi:hypothetical protein
MNDEHLLSVGNWRFWDKQYIFGIVLQLESFMWLEVASKTGEKRKISFHKVAGPK